MPKVCLIQDTWDDEDDLELLEYFIEQSIPFKIFSKEKILEQSIDNISVLFCDTCVIQKLLPCCVPSTYPTEFKELYGRTIKKVKYGECKSYKDPYFIKPFNNDKEFTAIVVRDDYDRSVLNSTLSDDDFVYVSEIVTFVNEYRLFIAKNNVVGVVESSDFILPTSQIISTEPPDEFINDVLKLNTHSHCVIDIGLLSTGKWSVVEVNPPFALSSYDWPIDKYYNYCKSAWEHIVI
jgi:hypothetical protein